MLMKMQRLLWGIWLTAAVALLIILVSHQAAAHVEEPEHLVICAAEDTVGDFTFPVANVADLKRLCRELEGERMVVDAPPVEDLVQWMYDLGLYDPYWLAPFDAVEFLESLGEEESPPPEG